MKKFAAPVLALFIISCSGSFKSTWNNFRAHYNIYYNAEKSFRAGLKEVEGQPVTINPERPIRVHEEPNGAGGTHFKTTIEKGVQLLRKFPDTKWVEDAVFLIGKSYYYQKEFYQALQKFEELYALEPGPHRRQQAIIWKGRVLLDLRQHQEAVEYLERELANRNEEWIPVLRAEVGILLGEHYAMIANWESSADYLSQSVGAITDRSLLGRTYFLYGQVLEHLKRYGEAYFAYDQVSSYYPDYEYTYWAEVGKGAVARREGNLDLALNVFTNMKNDDKNFQRQKDLDFEIAKTLEQKGDIKAAEQMYVQLLHSGTSPAPRDLKAKVYYRLGQVYSDKLQNYEAAAAYFDSASMQMTRTVTESDNQSAGDLASAYGRYTSLKKKINRADSLLWLGTLSPSELDSVIERIRARRRRLLQQQAMNNDKTSGNVLVNLGQYDNTGQGSSDARYGFLNYRNQNLVAESRQKFRTVWGRRPLVDDWRRVEVVAGIRPDVRNNQNRVVTADKRENVGQLEIETSAIPVTEGERKEMIREKNQARYELGSLFFLTLNLPDSALTIFRQIIREYPRSELEAKSMYSLVELYQTAQVRDSARVWADRIIRKYPESVYARLIKMRISGTSLASKRRGTEKDLYAEVEVIEQNKDSLSLSYRAERFRALALANRTSKAAPHVYFKAIRDYVHLAKEHTDTLRYKQFLEKTIMQQDTSGYARADVKALFSGAYWDSVRTLLAEYDTTFTNAPQNPEIRELDRILNVYIGEKEEIRSCGELGIELEVHPGMEGFLNHISLPQSVKERNLPEVVTYKLIINNDGSVSSYQLVSKDLPSEVTDVYDAAVRDYLRFKPFSDQSGRARLECKFTFPSKKP